MHVHPDGSVVATAELPDGRVLRVVGLCAGRQRGISDDLHEGREIRRKREPYDEIYKTLFLLGWRLDK